MTLSMSILWKL